MKKMTETNVKDALAGESQAHIKYLAFSDKAAAEKMPNVARIFKAASYSELVHVTNHLKTLGGTGGTKANLAAAAGGENFEVEEMYPAYVTVARAQGEPTAETFLSAAPRPRRSTSASSRRPDRPSNQDVTPPRHPSTCARCAASPWKARPRRSARYAARRRRSSSLSREGRARCPSIRN